MQLQIIHDTRYDYTPAVETARHLAHLRPITRAGQQQLLDHALQIEPAPAHQSESTDVFGNPRLFFEFDRAHDHLWVRAQSTVRTQPPPAPPTDAGPPWEAVRERFRYRKSQRDDAASEFLFASAYVPLDERLGAYAQASFTPGRPLYDAAADLMHRMRQDFIYDGSATEINTPAVQALAQRRGVCQDFAHIMIGGCRALGLPARYVSGYLLTQPPPGQPRLLGADASHAWVELYLPPAPADAPEDAQGTWVGFDPTNGRPPGEDYVTLALGRDYADVSPIRGVLHGGAHHALRVAVTVRPTDEAPDEAPAVAPGDCTPPHTAPPTPSARPTPPDLIADRAQSTGAGGRFLC